MKKKICEQCIQEKDLNLFYFRKDSNTYRPICKICIKNNSKEFDIKNPGKKNLNAKTFRKNHKEKIKITQKIYANNHKDERKEYDKIYFQKNKNKINLRKKNKYNNDPIFKIRQIFSSQIRKKIKINCGSKNNKSWLFNVNYSLYDFINRIECQFEDWMTWKNWGVYDPKTWNLYDKSTWTWNIDHKKPISHFKFKSMNDNEFKICYSLANLRPYSSKQNISDGNRR